MASIGPVEIPDTYLAAYLEIRLSRVRALMYTAWRIIKPTEYELDSISKRLDVPVATLVADTDLDAGEARRQAQLQRAASISGLTRTQQTRLLSATYARESTDPLDGYNPTTLQKMVLKAIKDAN